MAFSALLRFHLASASRVALRASLPQVVLLFVAIGLQPSPGAFLGQLAQALAAGEGWGAAPWAMGLWCAANAQLTVRRLIPATRGWHRHLAISPRQHRRAMLLACVAGQLPVAVFWGLLWWGAWSHGMPVRGIYLASLGLIVFAAASWALPSSRSWTRVLAVAGLIGGAMAALDPWLVGVLCLGLREGWETAWSEPLVKSRPRRNVATVGLMPMIAWRALGRHVLAAFPVAALLWACSWLFLNNNEVSAEQAAVAVRLCGALGISWLIMRMADQLRLRRPPWAWIRSQPCSARSRVMGDALWLAGHGLPMVIAAAWLVAAAAPTLLAWTAYLAMRASGALWRQNPGASRLGGATYAEMAFGVLWVAVSGWTGLVLALLLPWAWVWAARREQRYKVSRFHEMHHHLEGDVSA